MAKISNLKINERFNVERNVEISNATKIEKGNWIESKTEI